MSLWLEDEEQIQVLLGQWEVMSTPVRRWRAESGPPHPGGHGQSYLIYDCSKLLLVNDDLVGCVHSELCGVMKGKLWLMSGTRSEL